MVALAFHLAESQLSIKTLRGQIGAEHVQSQVAINARCIGLALRNQLAADSLALHCRRQADVDQQMPVCFTMQVESSDRTFPGMFDGKKLRFRKLA